MKHRWKKRFMLLVAVLLGIVAWSFYRSVFDGVTPLPEPSTPAANTSSTNIVPRLETVVISRDLDHVWDIAFLPDESLLITERNGQISIIKDGRRKIIHKIPDIFNRGEGGLMGLTTDPEFAVNRYVYACYDTPVDIRVSRWRLNDESGTLTGQRNIITGLPVNTTTFPGRHSGCRPRFGPDGNLWIGTGDAAIGTHPQDPKSLGGKILRVDRNGKGVSGNQKSPFDPRIYSYGHRNVQGLAMFSQPVDGVYGYSIEHGSTKDDEINPLKPGNFGRDPVPGYNDSSPMTDTVKFPKAIAALWSSGGSTIAPSGGTIITGSKWESYEGWLAMAVLKDEQLRLMKFDKAGTFREEKVLFKNEFGRLRSAVMGPDKNLYLTTDNGNDQDRVIKVTPL